jgi:hypothetical protein
VRAWLSHRRDWCSRAYFDTEEMSDDVAPALAELNRSGTVPYHRLAFVRKADDESVSCLEATDEHVASAFAGLADTQFDLLSDADLDKDADEFDPGVQTMRPAPAAAAASAGNSPRRVACHGRHAPGITR